MRTPIALTSVLRCPHCHSYSVRPALRMPYADGFVALLLLKPFRCLDCRKRHYNFFWKRRVHGVGEVVGAA